MRTPRLSHAITFLLGAALAGGAAVATQGSNAGTPVVMAAPVTTPTPAPATAPTPVVSTPQGGAPANFVELSRRLGPSVVYVSIQGQRSNPFATGGAEMVEAGQGTGFIVSADGYILTNEHVVSPPPFARRGIEPAIEVRLADGRTFKGKVVGADPATDLGLVKIEGGPFPVAPLGDSENLEIGEWVMAIGNPFGLDHSVTVGIVSAKGRRDVMPGGRRSAYYDFIQTDASINPGNSGGPLINMRGEVIGINSAISAQGQGIGFAIPVNMAKAIVPHLKQHGRVPRSYIGVSIGPKDGGDGARVMEVVPGSPAARVGVKKGDVITQFNGSPIRKHDDLPWLASMAGIGKTVPMHVVGEDGKVRNVSVTLEEMPAER